MIPYLWVPLLIRYQEKVDVISQGLGLQQQGEDQCELLRQSVWKHLTVERFDEMGLHAHCYRIASTRRFFFFFFLCVRLHRQG